ncbi:MAG: tRNA pseudouridine(38-40) synthase TruA [Chloroflexota bacterium]
MERYQVILAYDGKPFQGFQRQGSSPGEVLTVQGVFEAALRKLGWQGTSILAAGRTDTGVHATGQVVTFDLDWRHSVDDLWKALNAHLPPDLGVQQVQVVPPGFHPRFDAVARSYRYTIYHQPARNPLRERYAWRVWPPVEVAHLRQAAALLCGTHDFAAFGTPPRAAGSTWRTVQQAAWQDEGDQCRFSVTADAFLYHMVRRMVYVQVAVAQGRLELSALLQALDAPFEATASLPPGLAPPHGLVLANVQYLPGWYRARRNLEDQEVQFEQEA